VGVHLRRPSDGDLEQLLARCQNDRLTYEPLGGSLGGATPAGFTRRAWSTTLTSSDAFARAAAALASWAMHERAGFAVRCDGPIAVRTNVAISAPLPVGYADVTCRIVAVVDEPDRSGFAYGTLSVHPEQGEEAFIVSRTGTGLQFDITAVSRHRHPLARLAPAIADRMQASAAQRYLHSMEDLTAGT
jgi:uncharacterized protein (UPF0548 family)